MKSTEASPSAHAREELSSRVIETLTVYWLRDF
jgi:hypothetical protein